MNFRPVGLMLLFCLIPLWAFAQSVMVKGVVKDTSGEAIIGASVLEKGTTNGTITDFDGNFALNVSKNAVLVVSFVGYKNEEIPVAGKSSLKITLKEDSKALEEVVVIGYGSARKSDVTGSIASVGGEKLREMPATNITYALQNRVAGVDMAQTSSAPGASIQSDIGTFGDVIVGIVHQSEAEIFSHTLIERTTQRVTGIVLSRNDTLILIVSRAKAVASTVGTTGHADIVAVYITVSEHQVLPVSIHIVRLVHRILELACQFTHFGKLAAVHHGIFGEYFLHTCIPIVSKPGGTTLCTFVCSDQDNTIGTARTVDSSRGCILQDIHALDISGIDIGQITHKGDSV